MGRRRWPLSSTLCDTNSHVSGEIGVFPPCGRPRPGRLIFLNVSEMASSHRGAQCKCYRIVSDGGRGRCTGGCTDAERGLRFLLLKRSRRRLPPPPNPVTSSFVTLFLEPPCSPNPADGDVASATRDPAKASALMRRGRRAHENGERRLETSDGREAFPFFFSLLCQRNRCEADAARILIFLLLD